jgi:hypothetical protein
VVCSTCGSNLAVMREMLPTRAEWEAADRGDSPPAGRRSRWAAMSNARKQTIVSIAVIALFVVVLIAGNGTGSNSSSPRHAAGPDGSSSTGSDGTVSSPAATSSTPTSTTTASTPTVSTSPATVTSCAAAWNGGRSAEHRRDLLGTVAHAAKPGAVIATYVGPERTVARVGGGNPVLVNGHACVVAADDLVFLRQPDGSWGFSKATPTRFARIAQDPTWTADHANATVQLGSTAAAGMVIPRGSSVVVLTSSDVQSAR